MRRTLGLALIASTLGLLVWISHWQAASTPAARGAMTDTAIGRVSLTEDGVLSLARAGSPALSLGRLDPADDAAQRAALNRLRGQLEVWTGAGVRDPEEIPDSILEVEVDAAVAWGRALWLLEVVSGPSVRIHRLRLQLRGAPSLIVSHDLDGGGVIYAGPEALSVLLVRLGAEAGAPGTVGHPLARVSMAVTSVPWPVESTLAFGGDDLDWGTSWATFEGVCKEVSWMRRGTPVVAGLLDVPRPERFRVTYGEVFTVLRALEAKDVAPVWLMNRAMTLPGDR